MNATILDLFPFFVLTAIPEYLIFDGREIYSGATGLCLGAAIAVAYAFGGFAFWSKCLDRYEGAGG